MLKCVLRLIVLGCLVVPTIGWSPQPAEPTVRKLVLLHTSDEHSHLFAVGPESEDFPPATIPGASVYLKGGIARRATVLRQLRAMAGGEGAAVLTFSSGDNLMGTLAHVASTSQSPDFTALRLMGYNATTFGNHDFEVGPEFLGKTLQAVVEKTGSAVPIVATNIHFSGDPKAADALLASYMDETGKDLSKPIRRWQVITTDNSIKVGVLGVLSASAAHYAPGKAPVLFSTGAKKDPNDIDDSMQGLYQELQTYVDYLRNTEKVDLVIVLAHAGTDTTTPEDGESYKIAQNVSGIDVVLSGHTHLLVPYQSARNIKTGKEVVITEPGCFNEYVNKVALTVDSDGKVAYDAANCLVVPVTNAIAADPAMQDVLDGVIKSLETAEDVPGKGPYLQRSVSAITGQPVNYNGTLGSLYFYRVGKTRFDVTQDGTKAIETPILRLVADAFLAEARKFNPATDVAFSATGYTRDSISKGKTGDISLADVFRVLPLGISPIDGSLAHPLTVVGLMRDDLKKLIEITPSVSYISEAVVDLFTLTAGMCVEFDTARQPMDRVAKIRYSTAGSNDDCSGAVIYDVANGGWQPGYDEKKIFVAAMNLYHLGFAVPLYQIALLKPDGTPAAIPDVVLKRDNGNEVKSFEALAAYIAAQCEANGGYLPARYADPSGKRTSCSGPLCNQGAGSTAEP